MISDGVTVDVESLPTDTQCKEGQNAIITLSIRAADNGKSPLDTDVEVTISIEVRKTVIKNNVLFL